MLRAKANRIKKAMPYSIMIYRSIDLSPSFVL